MDAAGRGGLTPEQEEQAFQESPFHDSFQAKLLVNGRTLRSEGGSGFVWGPDAEQDAAEQAVLAHYALDPVEHWQLWRLHFPWKRRTELRSLSLTLTADPVWRPGPQFVAQPGQTVSFTHPATGKTHTLTVLALAPETLDVSRLPDVQEYPAHCLRLDYDISPELPPDALQIRDAAAEAPGGYLRRSTGQRRSLHRHHRRRGRTYERLCVRRCAVGGPYRLVQPLF